MGWDRPFGIRVRVRKSGRVGEILADEKMPEISNIVAKEYQPHISIDAGGLAKLVSTTLPGISESSSGLPVCASPPDALHPHIDSAYLLHGKRPVASGVCIGSS